MKRYKFPQIWPVAYRVLEVKMEDDSTTYYPQRRILPSIYVNITRMNGTPVECDNMEHAHSHILGLVTDARKEKQRRTVASKTTYEFNEVFEKLKR